MATVHNCSFFIIVHDSADVGTVCAKRGSRDMTSDRLWCYSKRESSDFGTCAYERLNEGSSDEG